jgi:hypothetical protein
MGKDIRGRMQTASNATFTSMEALELRSELQTAAFLNDYQEFQHKLAEMGLFVNKVHAEDNVDEAVLTEEYARFVTSSRSDISGSGRNVFMISLDSTPNGNLKNSILYKFVMDYNPYNENDARVLSLLGSDDRGINIYDSISKHCENTEDRAYCKSILSRMKMAMDADEQKGHIISDFVKNRFDECAKKAGFQINELYNVDMKKNNDEIFKAFEESRRPADFEKTVEENCRKYGNPGGGRSGGR